MNHEREATSDAAHEDISLQTWCAARDATPFLTSLPRWCESRSDVPFDVWDEVGPVEFRHSVADAITEFVVTL